MNLDLASLKSEAGRLEKTTSNNDSYMDSFVKFPEGEGSVVVRLLGPAAPGMFGHEKNFFYQSTRIHRVNNKSFHCLRELSGEKWVGECPHCSYYSWLWGQSEKAGSKDEADKMQAQARAIKPVDRFYYNCIVRKEFNDRTGEVRENVGPKILSVGKTIHKMIIRSIIGSEELDEPALGDVTDYKTGRDFKLIKTLKKSGSNTYPNYDTSKFLDVSPLGTPEQIEVWMAALHDLRSLRSLKPYEELGIELKRHLGLLPQVEETTRGGFDPSEYQSGSRPSNVSSEKASTVKVVETPPFVINESDPFTSNAGDDPVDDDFMKKLRGI